ncbi:MAG: hypothetical protein ACRDY6_00565 [Acidimicrobiia bacterium]
MADDSTGIVMLEPHGTTNTGAERWRADLDGATIPDARVRGCQWPSSRS